MDDQSPIWISPHYLDSQIDLETASIDDRITVFEDRIRGYFTTPSRLLSSIYHNGHLMVLLAVFSCVELIESFHKGESIKEKSKPFFKEGFNRIYQPVPPVSMHPDQFEARLDVILDEIYVQIRCGLMHSATTRSKVIIDKGTEAPILVSYDSAREEVLALIINPGRSLLALDVFLSDYCTSLRDSLNSDLRANFNKAWSALREEG